MITARAFGALGDGNTDETAVLRETRAFAEAVAAASESGMHLNLEGPEFTYAINTVSLQTSAKTLTIDGAGATILAQSPRVITVSGTASGEQQSTRIRNLKFNQNKAEQGTLGNYIYVFEASNVSIESNTFDHIGNGGIEIGPKSKDVLISNNRFTGQDSSTVRRAIWLRGTIADSPLFSSQLVNVETIERNSNSLNSDDIAPTRIRVVNNVFEDQQYGVYLMNTRFVDITNNTIEATARCVAVNNYSPQTKITDGICRMGGSGTGVLVTQVSHDVLIENMEFNGDYGGGRAIQVSYLAQALIKNNRFPGLGSRDIQIDMGGSAEITGNQFVKDAVQAGRHIFISPLDEHAVVNLPDSNIGASATRVAGSTITNNTFTNRPIVVQIKQNTLNHGIVAEMEETVLTGNTFSGRNKFQGGGERILNVFNVTGGVNKKPVRYRFESNNIEGIDNPSIGNIVYDPNLQYNQPSIQPR